jgi:hypothetical protein
MGMPTGHVTTFCFKDGAGRTASNCSHVLQWLQKTVVQMLEVRMDSKAKVLWLKADPALEEMMPGAPHTLSSQVLASKFLLASCVLFACVFEQK